MDNKFSVIITLYNKEAYIGRAIRSILRQGKKPCEIVIIDDKSHDNSLKTAKRVLDEEMKNCECAPRVVIIEHEENKGPGAARNTGLKAASGDYIFLLDADDEYKPGFFEKADSIFTKYGADLLFFEFERDPGGRRLPDINGLAPIIEKAEDDVYLIPKAVRALWHPSFGMNGSSVACKREALAGIFYNEDLICFEGIDFWYRVIKRMDSAGGGAAYLLAGIQVTIHLTKDSLSRKLTQNAGGITVPVQFSMFKRSGDIDNQLLRKRVFTIWMRNAMLRNVDLIGKAAFFWKFRKEIIENLILNLLYK